MAYQLITCPETAHLELIEYEQVPLGRLVQACSRFRPPHCVRCPRTCTARLDRRARSQAPFPSDQHDGAADDTQVDPTVVSRVA
ncbi:MAG: hypothetical protein H6709_07350 [Kofleriaceae bacterium]|nr:hypothetical protein [Myxococcales bacterium]MCB9560052.1 hypothetical protein [Kofleriaceae bacterium]MCB9571895.1 hypothetical protein [Kofleriaceae bacterium]